MRSARIPVIYALVLVLVLSSGAGGLSGSQQAPESVGLSPTPGNVTHPIPDTAAYLSIKPGYINETTTKSVTLDVGGSLALGTNDLDGEFQAKQFDAAYEQASESEQVAVVNNALDRSEQKLKELKARQKAAIAAYNNEEIKIQTFLRRLALIASEANQLDTFVTGIQKRSGPPIGGSIRKELETLQGPVRSLLQSTFRGDRDAPKRYFVRTTDHGVVLATIHNKRYFREAFLSGARRVPTRNRDGIKTMTAAIGKAQDLYPYVGKSEFNKVGQGEDLFRFEDTYRQGNLTTFLDKSSGKVFYEEQMKRIDDERTAENQSKTNGFAITVWPTHEGGPLIVKLTEPEDGDPLPGSVKIGNETIGKTNDEGFLYTLQPAGETEINATVKGESVTMTIGKDSTKSGPTRP